jgi:streptogramin lyase
MVGTLSVPSAIAIDISGNAWLANTGNNTVTEISSSGTTGTVFSGGNLSAPSSVAVDASSNVWVANQSNSTVTQISSSGNLTNYNGAGITAPTAIAINPK